MTMYTLERFPDVVFGSLHEMDEIRHLVRFSDISEEMIPEIDTDEGLPIAEYVRRMEAFLWERDLGGA